MCPLIKKATTTATNNVEIGQTLSNSGTTGQTVALEEMNTDRTVERDGGASSSRMYTDYNCNSEKLTAELPNFSWIVRHAAWTLTRYAPKADGRTSLFKLMSTDCHGELAKFSEFTVFPSCQNWQNSGKKLTGLET